ncbi:MAG: hypothetical protein GKR95_14495 [Gammaproteobacteria bacterium]|nr:hypothetical protein [Gammaproteobacteria bacterium]
MTGSLRRVYTASSLVEGTLLVNILIEAGIPAVLFHGNAMGGLGELPVIYPEIWIKRDLDEEKSLLVIRRFETASISITKRDDLLCGSCGEENPASFELCWNCSCALSLK